ncbi:hypothetical protein [Myxococcus sp. AB056]|uniref:hypothetical protein n=1 Tax=Myxococcus sp. AB056 TaxID=2562792 RepID=UPI001147A504|nr:hypothetical protein [Myxococcus sp. AB056]
MFNVRCNGLAANYLFLVQAALIAPGDPSKSVLSRRMHSLSTSRMPPLATAILDTEGTTLVDGWIASMPACPAEP